ncbi:MAG: CHAD domain-containing protein [Bacteroidales bacterium]
MDGNEIELKLAIDAQALNRVKRLPLLRQHRNGRTKVKELRSVYYDTADLRLAEAGITVRLRLDGGKPLQTVKTAGSRASGLFSRREWECPLPGEALDTAQLRATGLALLDDDAVLSALRPVFNTDIRRSVHDLAGDGWAVEMAIDVGEVRAGDKRQPISEIELELRQGSPRDLFALARTIAEAVPVRLLALSKSDRGYDLAADRGPAAVKARPAVLDDDHSVADAFRSIARNCLHHLLANQQALLENGDGEAVHQMRVALRRLRSALKIFRPLVDGPPLTPLREEMRWLLSQLGPARDSEVFLDEIVAPVVQRHAEQAGMAALHQHWSRHCADDLAAACVAVADSRFALLVLDLGAWVEAGPWSEAEIGARKLAPFARKVLKRLAAKLRKAGGKSLRPLSPPALHHVRILGKQLRYAAEFFAPLYGKAATRETLSRLGRLQDCLGEINDIAVAGPRLAACHHLGETAWAAGLVAGWHEARRPALMAEADTLWADWRKRDHFWDD